MKFISDHQQNGIRVWDISYRVLISLIVISFTGLVFSGCGNTTDDVDQVGTQSDRVRVEPLRSDFVMFLSGHWEGQMGPCGCTEHQLGGVDRRTHILNGVAAESRLMLDAGPLIVKESRQAELKLEAFIYSLNQLGYDGLALSGKEIIMLQEKLAMDRSLRPVVIATNMSAAAQAMYSVEPYLEKTLRSDKGELDCLVLAVVDPASMLNPREADKLQLQDPVQSIHEALMAHQVDAMQAGGGKLIVVLLPDDNEILVQSLSQIPALDLVVRLGYGDMPEIINNSNGMPDLATTGTQGKYITQLELSGIRGLEVKGGRFSAIPVEEYFELDPKIVSILEDYQLFLQTENLIEKLPRRALPEHDKIFTGSKSCADCHQDVYDAWSEFGHAHAMETLVELGRQYDPECVVCHVVGMEYENGYYSLEATAKFADVGCEMCHGPGLKHRENKFSMYQEIFTECEKCHTTHNSPSFHLEREEYFEKITHWREPRIYWK
ncbi:MAG: hypothetical protein GY869_26350 [Planctomycetes bacterium]|nr:hypothetical protein [Planctomycetota bacterium]